MGIISEAQWRTSEYVLPAQTALADVFQIIHALYLTYIPYQ